MNREIKFRAWDKERKDMLYQLTQAPCFGLNEKDRACSIEDVLFFYKNDFELMQYTGLKDKNGKEIYEGDIVKDCDTGKIKTVLWHKNSFVLRSTEGFYQWTYFEDEHEVIGNVYENPKLLEASND